MGPGMLVELNGNAGRTGLGRKRERLLVELLLLERGGQVCVGSPAAVATPVADADEHPGVLEVVDEGHRVLAGRVEAGARRSPQYVDDVGG